MMFPPTTNKQTHRQISSLVKKILRKILEKTPFQSQNVTEVFLFFDIFSSQQKSKN